MNPQICGTCRRAGPAKHGFLACELRKIWERESPKASCFFNPSKWIPHEPTKQARKP